MHTKLSENLSGYHIQQIPKPPLAQSSLDAVFLTTNKRLIVKVS